MTELRCIVLQMLLFLGVKRFNDIFGVRVKDVTFREDGSISVSIGKTKTDQQGRGSKFFVGGKIKGRFLVANVVKDYVERLKLKKEGFLFPQLRREAQGIVVKGGAVSYSAAYEDLKKLA